MDPEGYAVIQLFLLFVRIGITVFVVNRAGELNRSKWGWGLFAFFFPLLVLIIVFFMKPKEKLAHQRAYSREDLLDDNWN